MLRSVVATARRSSIGAGGRIATTNRRSKGRWTEGFGPYRVTHEYTEAETGFVYLRPATTIRPRGSSSVGTPLRRMTGSAYGYVDGNRLNRPIPLDLPSASGAPTSLAAPSTA
jgi:hypothetical protein